MTLSLSWRVLGRAAALALVCVLAFAPAEGARRSVAEKKRIAMERFDRAQKLREGLQGLPEAKQTRKEFQKVVDTYRSVYYIAPTSARADDSIMAIAELLAEMGRRFSDSKLFEEAIGQYRFMMKEYPGTKFRSEAIFKIAAIYKNDLHDAEAAKAAFDEFLKRFPNHRLSGDAKAELAELKNPRPAKPKQEPKQAKVQPKPVEVPEAAPIEVPVPVVETPAAPEMRPEHKAPVLVTSIRHWATADYTRVAIDLQDEVKYEAGRVPTPARVFFDLHDTKLASELVGKSFEVGDGFLKKIRIAQFSKGVTRVVLEVDDLAEYSAFLLPNPYRLIIDVHARETAKAKESKEKEKPQQAAVQPGPQPLPPVEDVPAATEVAQMSRPEVHDTTAPTTQPTVERIAPRRDQGKKPKTTAKKGKLPEPEIIVRPARPTAEGDRSLIRALGLKVRRIVVDAGHGGHDTGTIGPSGFTEKELVLDVALRLGKLLESRLGAKVVYTREDDTFIPLETRTAIANEQQADLFISVHANSSRDPAARGVETYYLNFTSSADALEVAARENAVSEKSIYELQDLVKKIALKEKIEESREFATNVQAALHTALLAKTRDRGVKKAPFIVLIGANMPSILAEISFLSNPSDEKRLKRADYRQKIAESLFKGVSKYADGLSGVSVALTHATVGGR